jgi:phosphoadenosine phosphosulfate reductase
MALLHMARDIKPDIPVLFLETGFHFPETTEFRQRIVAEWNLNFIELRGDHKTAERQAEIYGPELYRRDPDLCCHINKVAPLQTALEGYKGWISGVRRDQSDARSHTPVVQAQLLPSGKEVLKVHPLAFWTKADVEDYVRRNGIPIHPLLERGFASIGCWPCTRPITNGESERAGRWDGLEKTECGIHVFGTSEADSE